MAKKKGKPFPQMLDVRGTGGVKTTAKTQDGQTLKFDTPINRILMAMHKSMSGEDRAMLSLMNDDQTLATVSVGVTITEHNPTPKCHIPDDHKVVYETNAGG